jgi:hypothetical protein
MAGLTIIPEAELPPDGQCWCWWRGDVPCPNRATWRVENLTNDGYSLMCGPHQEGFAAQFPTAAVRYIALAEDAT